MLLLSWLGEAELEWRCLHHFFQAIEEKQQLKLVGVIVSRT